MTASLTNDVRAALEITASHAKKQAEREMDQRGITDPDDWHPAREVNYVINEFLLDTPPIPARDSEADR